MTQRESFLHAIAEDVYDDTPRLVFADWLEDNGDPVRAEFIRVQCELEPMRDRFEIDRAVELHEREEELLRDHQDEWLGTMPADWDDWRTGAECEFRRGFVDVLLMPVRTFLDIGAEILRQHPTVRRLVLFRVQDYGARLAACPALEGLPELELACWYSDADAEAIAASPYLSKLQILEIWLGRAYGLDETLCRTMAGAKAWPRLRQLSLLDPDENRNFERQEMAEIAEIADQVAGRKLATYRLGYPDVFPFAADFWDTFPGYLSDGRMAMAAEDHSTSPPSLCVLTFDSQGRQTEDVLHVPLPDDILAVPPSEWYNHQERMKEHLSATIGFRPGFIRIRDCEFPFDTSMYNRPSWETGQEVGRVDFDDGEEPRGSGGWVYHAVRNQEYVFGWDRYADKRGLVHST